MRDEEYIAECAGRKEGIKLVEPSENLCSAYLKMARESLASMNANIDMQYYADRTVSDEDYNKNTNSAPDFVIEMEKLASELDGADIERIRKKLKGMAGL